MNQVNCLQNRIFVDDFHGSIEDSWVSFDVGENLTFRIAISGFGEDIDDVSSYGFTLGSVIDDFIDDWSTPTDGMLKEGDSIIKARSIIENLRSEADRLEALIQK